MSWILIAVGGSAALSLAGTSVSAMGTMKQGADEYKAAYRKANRVIIDSKFKLNDIERVRMRTVASQRAAYIASGVKLSGSPLEIMAETNYYAGVDKARTEYEARTTAEEIRTGGRAALDSARYQTAGVLIGGAGKAIGAAGSSSQSVSILKGG